MDGWMFLEAFEEHARQLSKPVTIYMVSSSIAPEDKRKARSNPLIKDYLIKPLDPEKIGELLIGMHAQ
jgi:CheY-like chemotaxis protein